MSKKTKKLVTLFLILLLVVLVIGKAIQLVRNSVWDGMGHITIAIGNNDLEIWSIEPSSKTVSYIIVPKDTRISLSHYGDYKAGSVGKLSLLEKGNGNLMIEGLEQTFAIPIDGVILPKSGGAGEQITLADFLGAKAITQTISKRTILSSYLTNLSNWDLFRLWLLSFSLRSESIEKVDIESLSLTTKGVLPDGGEVFIVDRNRFSKLAQRYFKDSTIEKENQSIEVLNGTDREGKATSFALLLNNIGGNVISTGKSENPQNTSSSWVFAKKRSYTVEKIIRLTSASFSQNIPKESRADILVVLGGN